MPGGEGHSASRVHIVSLRNYSEIQRTLSEVLGTRTPQVCHPADTRV